jgi:hypothetical protein
MRLKDYAVAYARAYRALRESGRGRWVAVPLVLALVLLAPGLRKLRPWLAEGEVARRLQE